MIRFGTAGWRGVVGVDFTFRQVRLLLEAVITVLRDRGLQGEVLVAYDTRLLSEKFAQEAVAVLTHHGIPTLLAERDLPVPALAAAVRERRAALGIEFTASHNTAEYNGVKLYRSDGAMADGSFTHQVEEVAAALAHASPPFYVPQKHLAATAPLGASYLKLLERQVDWEAVARIPTPVVVDPLFGTAREFLDHILLAHGVPTRVIHATKDPYFGGYAPECTPANLAGLREVVRESGAWLGLATDGDADRFGVVDASCRAASSNLVVALLLAYLLEHRGLSPGAVGRTVATTRLVDRIAGAFSRPVVETPVGFLHLGPFLVRGEVAVAMEESAGFGLAAHLPERDGILACLLVAEMVGALGKPLASLTRRLFERYGPLVSRRIQLPQREASSQALARLQAQRWEEFAGISVKRVQREDGLFLELAGDCWVLWRLSGTEPKVRIYAEAPDSQRLRHLVREARLLYLKAEEEVRYVRN